MLHQPMTLKMSNNKHVADNSMATHQIRKETSSNVFQFFDSKIRQTIKVTIKVSRKYFVVTEANCLGL